MGLKDKIKSFIISKTMDFESHNIGIEEEVIIYDKDNIRLPVNFGEKFSCSNLLDIMNQKSNNNGVYSLEPGGQLEWSSPPFSNLNDMSFSMEMHKDALCKVVNEQELKILNFSVDPIFSPVEVDLINQLKYQLMDKNMEKVDTLGRWMMRNTASIQINYNFQNERELEEIVFIADCLQPVCSFLFSNAPFWENQFALNKNLRYLIWEKTDRYRCGDLITHNILEPKGLINKYIDYLLDVPSIFGFDSNDEICATSGTIGERLRYLDKNKCLREMDISAAVHQIFTNVRLKNLIEIRGADRPPFGFELAPVAFWTGLLLVEEIRAEILPIILSWSIEERLHWNAAAQFLDDSINGPGGNSYRYWNKWAGDLALSGLKIRGLGEEIYFEKFFDIILSNGPFSLQKQKGIKSKRITIENIIE